MWRSELIISLPFGRVEGAAQSFELIGSLEAEDNQLYGVNYSEISMIWLFVRILLIYLEGDESNSFSALLHTTSVAYLHTF